MGRERSHHSCTMNGKRGVFALFACLTLVASAEMRRFQNPEKTKSFSAELTAYDAKTKLVSVRLKNGRIQKFLIDRICEEDQKFVGENAKRLAVGNDLQVKLLSYQEQSNKVKKGRTTDRVQPSGYSIILTNRSKEAFSNLTLNYSVYYEVQGYLEPERVRTVETGTLTCKVVAAKGSMNLKTEPVEIVSGKLDPVIQHNNRRNANGEQYVETVVTQPGGRRKDLLVGCRVEIVVDGQIVKTVTEGETSMTE